MKKKLFLIACIFLNASVSFSQIDDIIKKVTSDVVLFEEKNVTTSIDDAYPVAFWLKDMDKYIKPVEPENYSFENLAPGYYRFKLQSYCLKAGTHGPTYGDGYLMSPLKGKRSDIVYNIVKKSVAHPDIEQHDIQRLLWGIIYGTKFTDFSPEFQNKVRPLLTPEEIADLSVDLKNIAFDLMPDDVKKTAKFYDDFRKKLTNPASSYADIEQTAMLGGLLPDDLNSKHVKKGLWSYIGNGFYARAFPQHYSTTYLELYKPADVNIIEDGKERVTSLECRGFRIDMAYDDEPGRDILSIPGKPDLPIWRLKLIRLSGTGVENEVVIENKGWLIRGDGKPLKTKGGETNVSWFNGDPTYEEYQKALKDKEKSAMDMNNRLKKMGYTDKQIFELEMRECRNKIISKLPSPLYEYFAFGKPIEGWPIKGLDPELASMLMLDLSEESIRKCRLETIGFGNPDITKSPAVPATNGKQRIIVSERKQD